MRFLKRLLVWIYIYLALFVTACFVAWCVVGSEPSALIAGACSAAGVESLVGGIIKLSEIKADKEKAEREAINSGNAGGKDTYGDT